jgi:NTP pyrophosphatase (non-canonical NTP hydrolase)
MVRLYQVIPIMQTKIALIDLSYPGRYNPKVYKNIMSESCNYHLYSISPTLTNLSEQSLRISDGMELHETPEDLITYIQNEMDEVHEAWAAYESGERGRELLFEIADVNIFFFVLCKRMEKIYGCTIDIESALTEALHVPQQRFTYAQLQVYMHAHMTSYSLQEGIEMLDDACGLVYNAVLMENVEGMQYGLELLIAATAIIGNRFGYDMGSVIRAKIARNTQKFNLEQKQKLMRKKQMSPQQVYDRQKKHWKHDTDFGYFTRIARKIRPYYSSSRNSLIAPR